MRRLASTIILFSLFITMPSAHAAVKRFALIVGNNSGGMGKVPLRYAEKDAENMYEVLKNLGQFESENLLVINGKDAPAAVAALDEFKKLIKKKTGGEDESLFVFYYSGHADAENLRIGDSVLSMKELKSHIKQMPADVRIAILDACQSGEFTQLKGGQKAAPFEVIVDDQLKASGDATISSSTAIESSQESEELAASYFSYFLTTGLRGAADLNGDNRISLTEAYQYAYNQTVAHSAQAIGPVQHPSFQYDLRGKGEIILTDLSEKSSALLFPALLQGDFFIYDKNKGWLVAELAKEPGVGKKLAVSAGNYVIKKKEKNKIFQKEIAVPLGQEVTVDFSDAMALPYSTGELKRALFVNYPSIPSTTSAGSSLTLQEGQIIKVRLLENLSSKTSYVGEKIHLEAATDVYINGVKAIREGAKVLGEIVEVKTGTAFPPLLNKKGFLKITIKYVEAVNGQLVPLSSVYEKKGRGGKLYNPKYLRGVEFDALVENNTDLRI